MFTRRFMMSKSVKSVFMLVLFFVGVTVAGSVSLAADPDKDDVTVYGKGLPPGCNWPDGEVYFTNTSSEYYYRVDIEVRFANHYPGPISCVADPPHCLEEACECEVDVVDEIAPEETHEFVYGGSCELPKCEGGDCENCDNSECEPPDFCTCPYGTYKVTHYKPIDGEWTAMPPSFRTVIEKEFDEDCPGISFCSSS
jgi:hypothetical protein